MRQELGREDSTAPFTDAADTFNFRRLNLCATIHPSVTAPFSAAHYALHGVKLWCVSWKLQRERRMPGEEAFLARNVPCANFGCAGATRIVGYGITSGKVSDGGVAPLLTPSGRFDFITGPKWRCTVCGTHLWDFERLMFERLSTDLQLKIPYGRPRGKWCRRVLRLRRYRPFAIQQHQRHDENYLLVDN